MDYFSTQREKIYFKICDELRVPVSTLGHVIDKWKANGTDRNRPRPSAQNKISQKVARKLVRRVKSEQKTTPKRSHCYRNSGVQEDH